MVGDNSLSSGGLDDSVDDFALSDVRESGLEVEAVGLEDWVVLGINGVFTGVGVFEVELEDESGPVLNADGAGGKGCCWRWRKRWSDDSWSGTDEHVVIE